MKQSVGVAVAAAAGLLLLAAPAHAAPKTEAVGGERANGTASAAEIAANNAAVWASLPPNVTMTVVGKKSKPQGPIDHYTQNGSTATTEAFAAAVATIPYDYDFTAVWSLAGRDFKSTQTKICKEIEATWDYPEGSNHQFKVKLSSGGTITVPTDGATRSWCWTSVPRDTTLHFEYYSTNNSSGDYARASGSGRVYYS